MKYLFILPLLIAMICAEQSQAWGRHRGHWVSCAYDQGSCQLPENEEFTYEIRYVSQDGVMTMSMPAMGSGVPCHKAQFTRSYSDGGSNPGAYCQYFDPRR